MYEKYCKLKIRYSNHLIIIGNGKFYFCYVQDAFIMKYLFNYKYLSIEDYKYICFPDSVYSKVINRLKSLNINYIVIKDYKEDLYFIKGYEDNNYCKYLDNNIEVLKDNIFKIINEFNYEQIERLNVLIQAL